MKKTDSFQQQFKFGAQAVSILIVTAFSLFLTESKSIAAAAGGEKAAAKQSESSKSVLEFHYVAEAEEVFEGAVEPEVDGEGKITWIPDHWNKSQKITSFSKGRVIIGWGSAMATHKVKMPANGTYYLWIYHTLHPTLLTTFNCTIDQDGAPSTVLKIAPDLPAEKKDDSAYIYDAGGSMGWSMHKLDLKQGEATFTLTLERLTTETTCPAVDLFVISGDPDFIPDTKSSEQGGMIETAN